MFASTNLKNMKTEVKKMMGTLLQNANSFKDGNLTGFINNDRDAMAFIREDDENTILVKLSHTDEAFFVFEGEGIFNYDTREELTLSELQDKILDFKNQCF